MNSQTLRVNETFYSLQGESSLVGLPTFFIRLTGCPLRCVYCDTEYAFHGGEQLSVEQLLALAKESGANYVCVTGGEPLAQPTCLPLLAALCNAGFQVSLETSGAISLSGIDDRVVKIVDLKTPASGEVGKNDWSNIAQLKSSDQVKFVICDRADYDWAKSKLIEYSLGEKVQQLLFSPCVAESGEGLPPEQLAEWILQDKLVVRFQMQLHKVLWGGQSGV